MIRPYKRTDKNEVVELLRLNIPKYFDTTEEVDFIDYLDNHIGSYFVLIDAGSIISAGGINFGFDDGKTARISWDMVHPDMHGKGFGSKLTEFRINEIKKHNQVNKIVVRTTQLVYPFYEKNGFTLEKTEKDYWAPGFDLYQLKIEL